MLRQLQSIRSRSSSFSFRLVQAALRAAELPTASGWEALLAKYEEFDYAAVDIDLEGIIGSLTSLHRQSCLAGVSAVWSFDAPEGVVAAMMPHLNDLLDPQSAFATPFPHPVEPDVLAKQGFAVRFVAIDKLGDGDVAVIGCGKRAYREREQIEAGALLAPVFEFLGSFDELIVVRSGLTQAYDRLAFRPETNRVELHVDLCCPMNSADLQQLYLAHMDHVKLKMKAATGLDMAWLNQPRNLFPYIKKLYNNADGIVISLGHATGTKSIKEERMRGQRLDLREELFHKHGIEAIDGTDAYSIKKGWPERQGNVPSVFIPGHFSNAGAADAAVRHAIIDGCGTVDEFQRVLGKLG